MVSPKVLPESQVWALGGGKLETNALPLWVPTDALVAVTDDFELLGGWVSQGFQTSVTVGLTNSIGFRCAVITSSENTSICVVPVGLVLRLDYLMRLLEREHGKPNIHVVDPDFYGDLPEAMRRKRDAIPLPEPVRTIADGSIQDTEFWIKLKEIDSDDLKQGRSSYRLVQIDQLRLALCFCALHESAHALRQHSLIIQRSTAPQADKRGAELDADAMAATWLSLYRLRELLANVGTSNTPLLLNTIAESAWRITYAVAVVLGLYDLDRLAIGSFLTDTYHHPSERLLVATNGMFHGFAQHLGAEIVKEVLVETSASAASEYLSRITQLWFKHDPEMKCRRCTSLYFPLTPGGFSEKISTEYETFLENHDAMLTGR